MADFSLDVDGCRTPVVDVGGRSTMVLLYEVAVGNFSEG